MPAVPQVELARVRPAPGANADEGRRSRSSAPANWKRARTVQGGSNPAIPPHTIVSVDPSELRRRVDALADEPDRLRRRLIALGALTARLAPLGIEPILVGGLALEVYTEGGYSTGDVDLALPRTP